MSTPERVPGHNVVCEQDTSTEFEKQRFMDRAILTNALKIAHYKYIINVICTVFAALSK